MKKLHLVITGGHHNSALVVAKKLQQAGHQVTWIGHRHATLNDRHDSAEYLEVSHAGLVFHDLVAGKLTIHGGWKNILNIPMGIFRALSYLSRLNPDAVLSFGGYLGFAVGVSAIFLRIPLYLHEQTVVGGFSNSVLARFARKVYLTWSSSLSHFTHANTEVVGLPLRESILSSSKHQLFSNSLPTILILGGKQGSQVINQIIFRHVTKFLTSYNLIHQTGTNSTTGDYEQALRLKDSLPHELAKRYHPRGYISEDEIGDILGSIDYYLGRSGAHITYELAVLGIRGILVPYLLTHQKEQLLNARVLEKAGLAIILPQSELSYPRLHQALKKIPKLANQPLNLPVNAADTMIQSILSDLY